MTAFHFIALTQQGAEKKGVIEAENEKHARQLLRERNYLPLQVESAKKKKTILQQKLFAGSGISIKELALITRQFATLLSAGLPIEEALSAVAEQTERHKIKALIFSVRSKVVEGHGLAVALREHPEAFSPLYSATVAAGEKTGHLDKILLRLADYTEQQWQMRQKLKTALIYPAMIICVAIAIVSFLLAYVVPKMVSVYGHLNQALPLLTQILISISHFVQSMGIYAVMALGGFVLSWRYLLKKYVYFRERCQHWVLRLPLIGNARKTMETARFARTLSILTAAGVPALEAMGIANELVNTIVIRKAIEIALRKVREGATIHLALKQTNFFSPMSVHMIASGEAIFFCFVKGCQIYFLSRSVKFI